MPSITLATQTVATQTGTAVPTIPNNVLNNSVTALDTTASNGPTSNADNTALPIFGCRAFVNFDGTSTSNVTVNGATEAHCAIRSSGNVSKVVKKGTGDYEVHFVTVMPDTNYIKIFGGSQISGVGNNGTIGVYPDGAVPSASQLRILCTVGNSPQNFTYVDVAIFR